MALIKITFDSNARDYAEWIAKVPEHIQLEAESRVQPIKTKTKRVVQSKLVRSHGVRTGVYRKSFTINSFAENKWQIGFQVFAKKPHYRLTHLLEGRDNRLGGHRIKVFTKGKGTPTYKGNIGMSFIKTRNRPSGFTKKVIHIEPGQEYADEAVFKLYEDALTGKLTERMKKIK